MSLKGLNPLIGDIVAKALKAKATGEGQ